MKTIKEADFKKTLGILLEETFEGAPPDPGSVYLDARVGVFFTLDEITADQASRQINQTSIAAHAEHIRFYLETLNKYMHSTADFVNWQSSWRISSVDSDQWIELRKNLRGEYQKVTKTFNINENWDVNYMTVAMAIIAHSAYHLGAIRQIFKQIKDEQQK